MSTITIELSAREREVAEIAARGFTSRYVARKLCISDRTVETHLRSVYGKLGITTRDELIERFRGDYE